MSKKNVVVGGLQLGDEGKARAIDYLAKSSNYVVRFQGGANSGHTIWVDGRKVVCHLVPSGILYPHVINVIATGVMVDPISLLDEIRELRARGITVSPSNLKVASNASVVTKLHRAIDMYEEAVRHRSPRGTGKIGTTCRGIGPSNEDRVGRRGLKLFDLLDRNKLWDKLSATIVNTNKSYDSLRGIIDQSFDMPETFDGLVNELLESGKELEHFFADTSLLLDQACREGGVLFEGAQSGLLDVDHGSYPFVTSSHCVAGYAAVGCGISPLYIDEVVGIMKGYTTRVGAGPFPTEIIGAEGELLREKGSEYGATTGRPRKVGWLDMPALKYSTRIHGLTSVVINKLDVMDYMDEILVCTHYELDGKMIYDMPADHNILSKAVPQYKIFKGWKSDVSHITDYKMLPRELEEYVSYIANELGVEIKMLGVGQDRNQTIVFNNRDLVLDIDVLKTIALREVVL